MGGRPRRLAPPSGVADAAAAAAAAAADEDLAGRADFLALRGGGSPRNSAYDIPAFQPLGRPRFRGWEAGLPSPASPMGVAGDGA